MRFQARSGRYRALIVDDDGISLAFSYEILVRNGFMTDKANSGSEAINFCKKHVYDIIFMDLEMPTLDGYQVVRAIRKMRKGSTHAYIIALTGTIKSQEQAQECLKVGMNDCIAKPLDH